jgi:KTSC domain-containing protein
MASTTVQHISYDEAARELHVTFVGGAIYTYYDVPAQVYRSFRTAESKGQFFNQFVRDRYDFRRHAA